MRKNIMPRIISHYMYIGSDNKSAYSIIIILSILLYYPVAALAPGTISTGELIIDNANGRIGWPIAYTYGSGSVYLSQIYLYWPPSNRNLISLDLADKQIYGGVITPPFAAITSGLTSIIADKSIYYTSPKILWFNFEASQLVGDSVVETVPDSTPKGVAEAFSFTATASGTARAFNLYVDSASTASVIDVGVYSDASTNPSQLLKSARLSTPVPGTWNKILIEPISIDSGTKYWLAVLLPNNQPGTISFRTKASGTSWTSKGTNLNYLPDDWVTGGSSYSSTISAYLSDPSLSENLSEYKIRAGFYTGEYIGYPSFPTCALLGSTEFCDASLPWHNASVTNQISPFMYSYTWKVDSVTKGTAQNIQIDWASLAVGMHSLALTYAEKYSTTTIWSTTIEKAVFNVKKPVPVISIE